MRLENLVNRSEAADLEQLKMPPLESNQDTVELENWPEESFSQTELSRALRVEDPIREMASELRSELHEFIHSTMQHEKGKIGFQTDHSASVSIAPIMERMRDAVETLENVFQDSQDLSLENLQDRAAAHSLQSKIELFLNQMGEIALNDELSIPRLPGAREVAIHFKAELANVVQSIDAQALQEMGALS